MKTVPKYSESNSNSCFKRQTGEGRTEYEPEKHPINVLPDIRNAINKRITIINRNR
jgi:hypothetical protein